VKRRERTRQLIELGGLVAKAELIDLTDDDRAVIFGLLIEAAATLRGEHRQQALTYGGDAANAHSKMPGKTGPPFRLLILERAQDMDCSRGEYSGSGVMDSAEPIEQEPPCPTKTL
jgi:hypothetical protein